MKKALFFAAIVSVLDCRAQNSDIAKIGLYKWNEVVLLQPCKLDGTNVQIANGAGTIDEPTVSSIAGQQFRVVAIIGGANAIIQILDYTISVAGQRKYAPSSDFYKYNYNGSAADYAALSDEAVNSRSYGVRQRYFKVGIAYVESLAVREGKIGGALAAGVINFPFKYRPQGGNQDFSGAFNFGAGIGYKFPHKSWRQFTYSVLSGYSISSINLDSASANKNQGKLSSTNNFTAFSFSLGVLTEYQRVQAGLFVGWDRLSKINQRQFDWQYQGKPWISVGFGFAIFSGQKEKVEKTSQVTQNP